MSGSEMAAVQTQATLKWYTLYKKIREELKKNSLVKKSWKIYHIEKRSKSIEQLKMIIEEEVAKVDQEMLLHFAANFKKRPESVKRKVTGYLRVSKLKPLFKSGDGACEINI
jgi:hypothetical protein